MNSLPLYIYTAVRSGEPAYIARGYGAASVLLIVVLVLFIVTRLLGPARRAGNPMKNDRRMHNLLPVVAVLVALRDRLWRSSRAAGSRRGDA